MTRKVGILLLALAAAACGSDERTVDARGEMVIKQTLLEFPRTYVGYHRTIHLDLENTGFTPIDIELGIEGPFSMRSGKERLSAGSNALPVTFRPRSAGEHAGKVFIYLGGETHEVFLAGIARDPPGCLPSAPCREVSFDPETGKCSEAVVPDHTPCRSGNRCQEDEICLDGACVGSPVDCDDGSVCTADSCDPARGCVNLDVTAQICHAPSDPCLVATCDPDLGCGAAAVVDGTICGEANCKFADMCIGGECGRYDVPDGTDCTHACGEGECKAGECFREEGDVLADLWDVPLDVTPTVIWSGVTDVVGQVYWIEASGSDARLASATTNGVVRYREPIPWPGSFGARSLVLEGNLLLVAAENVLGVSAHDPASGAPIWVQELAPDLAQAIDCPCLLSAGALTRTAEGQVVYTARVDASGVEPKTILAKLHASSGDVLSFELLGGAVGAPPVADEAGALYLVVDQGAAGVELVSIDGDGAERWRVPAPRDAAPLAAWGGIVQLSQGAIFATADGERLDEPTFDLPLAVRPILGPEGNWAFTAEADGDVLVRPWRMDGQEGPTTALFDGPSDPLDTRTWTEAMLTRRDTVLLATSQRRADGWETLLREVKDDGSFRRTCDLDVDGSVEGVISLRSGRLVARIVDGGKRKLRAWALPNGEPGVRGWIGPFGDAGGGGRPQ